MMPRREWQGTGYVQEIDAEGFTVNRIPEYDTRSRDHLWVVMTMYRMDPAQATDPTATPILDSENLLSITGLLCYHCEELYTPYLARRRCPGDPK